MSAEIWFAFNLGMFTMWLLTMLALYIFRPKIIEAMEKRCRESAIFGEEEK